MADIRLKGDRVSCPLTATFLEELRPCEDKKLEDSLGKEFVTKQE